MAEPQEQAAAPPEGGGKRSILRMAGVALGVILVCAIAAVLVYRFVIQPRLNADLNHQNAPVNLETVPVPFEETFTTVIMPSENMLASTLLYKVTLECSNQETASLIDSAKYKSRFIAMIRKLHSYKTRAELDDPLVEESIRKQILQEANSLLAEIQGGEVPQNRVVAVYHEKFYIQDA